MNQDVAATLLLRRMIRRSRRLIALTEVGDLHGEVGALGPTPIVPAGPTREQWSAGIRALDERLPSPPGLPGPARTPGTGNG